MKHWKRECEALFEAGRAIDDEPTARDRERIARGVAARLAEGAAAAGALHAATTVGVSTGLSKAAPVFTLAKFLVPLAIGAAGLTVAATMTKRAPSSAPQTIASAPLRTQAPARAGVVPSSSAPRSSSLAPTAISVAVAPAPKLAVPSPSPAIEQARATLPPPPIEPGGAAVAHPESIATARIAAPASASSSPSDDDAVAELQLVRRIDTTLRGADYATALSLLNEHDARFGHGHLAEECDAARVLASCGASPTTTTRAAACTFVAEHPQSPMRGRIERTCAATCEGER